MRFRFCEADRAKYGAGWYDIDPRTLDDPRFDGGLIERFEDATGFTIMVTLAAGLLRGEHRAVRALMWLASLANGEDLPWADFWPNLRAADIEPPERTGEDEGNSPRPKRRATTGTGRSMGRRSANTSTTTS